MSIKKIFGLSVLLSGLILSVGCATSSKNTAAVKSKEIERVIVDYKGAVLGGEIPSWVEAVVNDDFDSLQATSTFKDKGFLPVVAVERGKNLDLLKSWANNFSVQGQISRAIQNKVSAEFGGNQEGDKNSEESLNFVKEIVATFSRTNVSGLKKEKDYWVKLKVRDNAKKTEEEYFEYYVLYSISAKDLQEQIDIAMGKIEAKTQIQKELKNEVKDALSKLKGDELSSTSAN